MATHTAFTHVVTLTTTTSCTTKHTWSHLRSTHETTPASEPCVARQPHTLHDFLAALVTQQVAYHGMCAVHLTSLNMLFVWKVAPTFRMMQRTVAKVATSPHPPVVTSLSPISQTNPQNSHTRPRLPKTFLQCVHLDPRDNSHHKPPGAFIFPWGPPPFEDPLLSFVLLMRRVFYEGRAVSIRPYLRTVTKSNPESLGGGPHQRRARWVL